MRIGFDGRVLRRDKATGVERYAANLYNELSRRADIRLFLPPGSGYRAHLWTNTQLLRKAREAKVDVLLSPATTLPLVGGGPKLVTTIHDINFLLNPALYSWKFRNYYRVTLPWILQRADGILCNSNFTRSSLCDRYPWVAGRTKTVYHAASKAYAPTDIPREAIILGVASRNPNKNLARLIRAFAGITTLIPHKLVLVGSERAVLSHEPLDREIKLCSPGRILLTGFLSDHDLKILYNKADFLAFPSLCEGFGVPPLEAMQCGLPVLTSFQTSLPEICGEAALYCNPLDEEDIANKLVQMATSPLLKEQLRAKGFAQASKYSFSRCADETLNFLVEIAAKPHLH